MTSHVLHRCASVRTRTFALAVAGALTASMLVVDPAAGSGGIERLGSVALLESDGEPNSGLAVSDATHAYFAFGQGEGSSATGTIVKVDAVTLQRVGATAPVVLPSGWSSLVMDSDHLYAATNEIPAKIVQIDKSTMNVVATLELSGSHSSIGRDVREVRVAHVAAGFGYFGGVAGSGSNANAGIVKVKLSDMSVDAYREIAIEPAALLTGVFDADDAYVIYAGSGDNFTYRRVLRFALGNVANGAALTPAAGDLLELTSPHYLPAGHSVQSVVMDANDLYLATGGGHVIKVGKDFPTSPRPSVALHGTPNLQSAVLAGSTSAYFSGDARRVAKVDLSTLAIGSSVTIATTDLCPREFVGSAVLAPSGDLLVATRSGGLPNHVTSIVRVGAGSRAACPGESVTTGGGGGGDAAAEDAPVATAIAAASAANVAGSSSAVLVRGGEVVPVTSSRAAGAGPRGGVVLEAEGLRVTVAAAGGASPQTGVVAPVGGEIVCELCAAFAAGSTIEAWLYSSPQLVAAVQVPADHQDGDCILLRVPVGAPLTGAAVTAGAHTLQLRMPTTDGLEVLATGVTVGTAVPARVPAGEGPADRGLLGVLGLLAAAGAAALVRRSRASAVTPIA